MDRRKPEGPDSPNNPEDPSDPGNLSDRGNEIRRRWLYRNLVLRGQVRLPNEAARRLVGPDCAFHLYSQTGLGEEADKPSKPEP